MATNNNLLEWAVVFSLACADWSSALKQISSYQYSLKGRDKFRNREPIKPVEAYKREKKARDKIFQLRTELPGVLTLAGFLPADTSKIVTAFDAIKDTNSELNYTRWFQQFIRPLVKFPARINPADWPY
jgi:hypothetical protein